jgi:DNA ligase-1
VIKRHGGDTFCEIKYDGYRINVHKYDDGKIRLFTRNLNELSIDVFPDLLSYTNSLPSGIFDCEMLGMDEGIDGFNAVKKRVRKEAIVKDVENYPLQLRFFDVLLDQGKELIDLPLSERRRILENYSDNVSLQANFSEGDELSEYFSNVTNRGLEGLVCKNPTSKYKLGARNNNWVKLKKFLTLDLAVLGVYQGVGKAASLPFAALLLGAKKGDKYETITKVGISNKQMIDLIHSQIGGHYLDEAPENVVISDKVYTRTYARKKPAAYVSPLANMVIEVEAMNVTKSKNWHTCGLDEGKAYSLRIPRIIMVRDDKTSEDCNTTYDISGIYGD